MKITACSAWPVTLTLEEPFTIAYSTTEKVVNYFLKIETDSGITGFGCSAFDEEVTGENEESVKNALNDIAIPLLLGLDPLSYSDILFRLRDEMKNFPTAMASVDMALYDILGKKANLPLYKLLGAGRNRIASSITIGILPVERLIEKALMWKKRGYFTLKIKGGLSVDEDIEKLIKVREQVGNDTHIYFDANQGYSVEEAKRCILTLDTIHAKFIEQPCKKDNHEAFTLLKNSKIRVMADEAVLGPEDVALLYSHGGADMYNIKLAKTGGIHRALQLDAVASSIGARTMVGCMDEAGLGIAAALHMALSSNNVEFADLDGHVEFIDDPSYDAVRIKDGFVYPNESPGLGFSF
ncbi:MAG: dipeptide epimerase [Spirochaetia bacterium]|nr:dipeptide epimerase [Spirochaetia bacterium]